MRSATRNGTTSEPGEAPTGAPSPSVGTPFASGGARAPWRRLSVGHLVMVGAGLLGAALTLVALRSAEETEPVAVASRDLFAGERVSDDDLDFVDVDVDGDLLGRLVRPGDVSEPGDLVATTRVSEGDLVARSVLVEEAAPDGKRAMSVPVDASRAVGGALEVGDHVDVVAVVDREPDYAVADTEVLAVHRPDRGAIGSGLETFSVTIAVDDTEALEVARGIEDGSIVIVRATGADRVIGGRADAP